MIHIDHSLLPNATPSPPEPALPILASHLLELEEQQRKRFARHGRPERLSTGCRELDEVLGGDGTERGVVLGISASVEAREGRLLSLHLLASTLLPCLSLPSTSKSRPAKPKATIIDTAGSFPLALLASVLKSRLLEARSLSAQNAVQTGNHAVQEPKNTKSGAGIDGKDKEFVDEQVQQCLEMVAISRVFDIEGLWEVIGEVDHVESSLTSELDGKNGTEKAAFNVTDELPAAEQDIGPSTPEILDSEEDTSPPSDSPSSTSKEEGDNASEDEGIEIIIVDNMTHIINELFARKEKSDAHTLLTLLSSTLHTLSKTNNILTILHNTTNPSTTSTNTSYPPPNPRHNHNQPRPLQSRSIFSSATHKPALGQIFAQFPDVHLLVHALPRGRRDAEILYGGDATGDPFAEDDSRERAGGGERGGVRYTTVIEVLKDEAPSLHDDDDDEEGGGGGARKRFAYREQRWTAVDVRSDGMGLVCAFAEPQKGGGSGGGVKMNIEEGLSAGVGNVAKIWGFGGRRV
ncbi:hypothetical protein BKA64DRAFT_716890 [Cadophora sp. MPI-SDFR-AT-0126]|nr:hypothetical protein BKA64DRAFT_716890 [Leotiomycetes sp. MPI-SDFR-AT-0126]